MWFVLRAVLVIAVIAFFSPQRGGAEREAGALASAAGAHLGTPAQIAAQIPEPARERVAAEAGHALAQGAEAALRGALTPGFATR